MKRLLASRSGFIFALVFVLLLIVCILVMALGTNLGESLREVAHIQDDTQHMYYSEAVFAQVLNHLKKRGWRERFYDPLSPIPAKASATGKYRDADYVYNVQDVKDTAGQPLPDLTDVFVKVTYRDAAQNFYERVRFRQPTTLRPTGALIERFGRTVQDTATPDGRKLVLAALRREGEMQLANAPKSRVFGRKLMALARRDCEVLEVVQELKRFAAPRAYAGINPPPGWDPVLGSQDSRSRDRAGIQAAGIDALPVGVTVAVQGAAADVALEGQIMAKWLDGDTALTGPPIDAATARTHYEMALALSRGGSALQVLETVPRSLFKLAAAITAQAEKEAMASTARLNFLKEAAAAYDEITSRYAASRDAPHSYIPWAWLYMKSVDQRMNPDLPINPVPFGAAIGWNIGRNLAYAKFEELRQKFPQYHLWGEDAVTTPFNPAPGGTPGADEEIVFYERELIKPRLVYTDFATLPQAAAMRQRAEIIGADAGGTNAKPLFPAFAHSWDPSGSLEGTKLVFLATFDPQGGNGGPGDIFVSSSDGSAITRLTRGRTGLSQPHFSPDGKLVLFTGQDQLSGGPRPYVIAVDGSGERQLTFGPAWDHHACWSPDGTQVLFERAASNEIHIWAVDVDGNQSNLHRLTDVSTHHPECWPRYCPDGTCISYMTDRPGIWLMDPDGTHQRQFIVPADPSTNYIESNWSPNGQQFLVVVNSGKTNAAGNLATKAIAVVNRDGSKLTELPCGSTPRNPVFTAGHP